MTSTQNSDALDTDTDEEFISQTLPKSIPKHYSIYKIFFNQTQPRIRPHSNTGFDGIYENEILSDDPLDKTINIIGLLVALLVSVFIIMGVAFIIRKIRKRQGPIDDDSDEGVEQTTTKSDFGTFPEMVTVNHNANAVQGDPETPQIFTITFMEVPKKQKMYIRALPKFLRPKPKQVDIEKIKRELGHVYVY